MLNTSLSRTRPHTFIDLTFLLVVGSGPFGFDPTAWQKADWFFSPSLHYIHWPLGNSRQERKQAAAQSELITHCFNWLAQMRTETQRMPENTPCAPFKQLWLTEWRVSTEYELTGLRGDLEVAHFDIWQKQIKKPFVSSSTFYGFNLFAILAFQRVCDTVAVTGG